LHKERIKLTFSGCKGKKKMDIIHKNRIGKGLLQKKEKRIYNGN